MLTTVLLLLLLLPTASASRWLLMCARSGGSRIHALSRLTCCAATLGSLSRSSCLCSCVIEEVTCGKAAHPMLVRGMTACFSVLLRHLSAAPDARDTAGRTAAHWLVITAISEFEQEEVQFKPNDSRLQAGLETAGVKPPADDMGEPWLVRHRKRTMHSNSAGFGGAKPFSLTASTCACSLLCPCLFACQWSLFRWRIEPAMCVLLRASKRFGYVGDIKDIVAEAASGSKSKLTSLLDLADSNGNTPLHWAAAHRNVPMVGW